MFDSRKRALDVAPFGRKRVAPTAQSRTFSVPIVGRGGLPAFSDTNGDGDSDAVLAVAANVTVVASTKEGFLRAFGTGAPEANTAYVNFKPGQVVPNNVIVRPGRNGMIDIRLVGAGVGSADVVIDVFGFFSTSSYGTRGARLIEAGPGRVWDSRKARFGDRPVGPDSLLSVPIRGADAFNPTITDIVPNSNKVTAVMVNISGVNNLPNSAATYLSALPTAPASGKRPSTANLNLVKGQIRSNLSIVPIGPDGTIKIYNRNGYVDVVVDVVGYMQTGFPVATSDGRVIPLVSAFRALDTRKTDFGAAPLPPAQGEDWSFKAFVQDVKIGGQPIGPQKGLIGNLTATNLQRQYPWAPVASFMTAYPTPRTGNALPYSANLTIAEGENVPNMAMLAYGARPSDSRCQQAHCVRFYNRAGFVHYVLDVSAVILSD